MNDKLVALIIIIVGIVGVVFFVNISKNIPETKIENTTIEEKSYTVITVKDKWVKRVDNIDLYLVGTDKGVYKIEDNLFLGKFNSSDIYNNIDSGKTYKITTTGFRNNLLSTYENINTIEEIKEEE